MKWIMDAGRKGDVTGRPSGQNQGSLGLGEEKEGKKYIVLLHGRVCRVQGCMERKEAGSWPDLPDKVPGYKGTCSSMNQTADLWLIDRPRNAVDQNGVPQHGNGPVEPCISNCSSSTPMDVPFYPL